MAKIVLDSKGGVLHTPGMDYPTQGPGMQASPTEATPAATPTSLGQKGATTHEAYLQAVKALAIEHLGPGPAAAKLADTKVVFGAGERMRRGSCYYGAWRNGEDHDLIEICALGKENDTQLAGTILHELGHALAGHGAGHGAAWRDACANVGLIVARADSQEYAAEHFDPVLWAALVQVPKPADGAPNASRAHTGGLFGGMFQAFRAGRGGCHAGRGTKGGKSTGPGSGRMHLWVCECDPPQRVRKAGDLHAACTGGCGKAFTRTTPVEPVPAEPAEGE